MKPVEEVYREGFFHRRNSLIWRAPILCGAVEKVFSLDKSIDYIVDIGCAIGEFVEQFRKMGYRSQGWDGSHLVKKYQLVPIYIFDIRRKLRWSRNMNEEFTLCMCLEVAEHIEEEYVEVFVDNLCKLSDRILISAAPPGQQGHGHYNCQPKEYWEAKFKSRGYFRDISKEECFKKLLEPHKRKKGLNAYYGNTMIYQYRG